VVLDGVVGPAVEHLSNFRPLVFEQAMHQEQNPLFFLAPVDFLNFGVQVIVPALTTLLADSPWELLRDRRPFLGTVLLNELKHFPVLFLRPGSLDDVLRRVPFFFMKFHRIPFDGDRCLGATFLGHDDLLTALITVSVLVLIRFLILSLVWFDG